MVPWYRGTAAAETNPLVACTHSKRMPNPAAQVNTLPFVCNSFRCAAKSC